MIPQHLPHWEPAVRDPGGMAVVPQIVAHRGASAQLAEHTGAAYRSAIEQGAEALECDVRLTADGHLVCVHDSRIDRTSDGRGRVSNKTLEQLQEHDFASWWSGADDEPQGEILTLDALIEMARSARHRVELAIETKHPTRYGGYTEQALVQALARHGLLRPDPQGWPVRVMSFSAIALRRMRDLAPGVPTVYLMDRVPRLLLSGTLPFSARIAGPGIDILRSDPGAVRIWQAAGNDVHVWTVDTQADVEMCVAMGVTAMITSRPAEVLAWREQAVLQRPARR